jgi:hypothetical protein
VPEAAQRPLAQELANTYGKTFLMWHVQGRHLAPRAAAADDGARTRHSGLPLSHSCHAAIPRVLRRPPSKLTRREWLMIALKKFKKQEISFFNCFFFYDFSEAQPSKGRAVLLLLAGSSSGRGSKVPHICFVSARAFSELGDFLHLPTITWGFMSMVN